MAVTDKPSPCPSMPDIAMPLTEPTAADPGGSDIPPAVPAGRRAGAVPLPAPDPAPGPAPVTRRRMEGQRAGILTMCLVSLIFAVQDAVSRHLGALYPPVFVTMLRYWFFALFAVAMAARGPGGLRAALRSAHPVMQSLRGLILVAEVVLMLIAFVRLGIVATHAVFTVAPLLVVALSGPVLGERIGWRRWLAVGIGFLGMLVVLKPGFAVFSPWAILPLVSAFMFALYALMTRRVSAEDSALVSFFWTGVAGALGITLAGIWFAQPIARADWPWMAALCLTGVVGHYLLIRAYELAEASSLQPFAYTQLVWVTLIGVFLLGETVEPHVIVGMAIIVSAGLFTWWRTMKAARQD